MEPGPVGASVDPLGDVLGETVLPEGFMVVLGLVVELVPMPVVPEPTPLVPPVVDGLLMPVPADEPAEPAPAPALL